MTPNKEDHQHWTKFIAIVLEDFLKDHILFPPNFGTKGSQLE
ncbi:25025_t:CDS:2 [Gigaspora margarita]|uniref:25025_t:CDS:1 n=1 Tax=Gigaspora margarita TaxID=4874 RepID=A0ABN7V282_GIGMA|nr:25025_t:CDS:2 [Gigaspora margarita]